MTKTKKENLKKKTFKFFAILSFVINILVALFLLLGLLGNKPKTVIVSAIPLEPYTNYEQLYYESFQPVIKPNQNWSYKYKKTTMEVYKNFTGSDYSQRKVGTFQVRSLNYERIGRSGDNSLYGFDFKTNSWDSTYYYEIVLYYNNTYTNSEQFLVNSNTPNDLIKINFVTLNFSVSDYELFCKNFYTIFSASYDYENIKVGENYVLKPFINMRDFKLGVTYPIDIHLVKYKITDITEASNLWFRYFYIDYNGSIILKETTDYYFLGSVKYDAYNNPYLEFYNNASSVPIDVHSFINLDLFDGYYFDFGWTSNFVNKFLADNSQEVYNNPSGEEFVSAKGNYYLNWTKLLHTIVDYTTSSNDFNYDYELDFNYSVKGIDEKFNKLIIKNGNNGSNHTGYISGVSYSGTNYYFYRWYNQRNDNWNYEGNLNNNLGNIYTAFPYYIEFTFDGLVPVNDYALLSFLISPVSIEIPEIVMPDTTFNSIFSVFGSAFKGISNIANIQIFPGISILTLCLIPLFVFLIIAIIKLLKA